MMQSRYIKGGVEAIWFRGFKRLNSEAYMFFREKRMQEEHWIVLEFEQKQQSID